MHIYLEDAPLDESSPGRGLSKALLPMLHELASVTSSMDIVQTHGYAAPDRIERLGSFGIRVAGKMHFIAARSYRRLPFVLASILAALHGALVLARGSPARRLESSDDTVILAPIGVDPFSLIRIWAMAHCLRRRFDVYLVDDIETHPTNAGRLGLNYAISRVLKSARRIYAITPELGQLIGARYGLRVATLPLTAQQAAASQQKREKPQFLACYLGSINHLYASGLATLIEIVTKLRSRERLPLTLRIIARPEELVAALNGPIPEWITCGPAELQSDLQDILASSAFCYLPYSFSESAKIMTQTSFPSKLIDYLGWARQIIVFAPQWSVPYGYFSRSRLSFVTDDERELAEFIETTITNPTDLSDQYCKALKENHGAGIALRILERHDALESPR